MEQAITSRPAMLIAYGNFIFKYRNRVFPLVLLALFLSFPPQMDHPNLPWIGFAVALSGQLIRAAVIGFAYIKRGGLNKKVYAEDLVTTGFFGACRNPLYVGNMLNLAGLLIIHGNLFVVLSGVLFFYITYEAIIAAEERYLLEKFGDSYREYCARVPRWAFKLSQLKEATDGMQFNFRKVIYKDYATAASWGTQALALFAYRDYWQTRELHVSWLFALLALGLVTLAIRTHKKKHPL